MLWTLILPTTKTQTSIFSLKKFLGWICTIFLGMNPTAVPMSSPSSTCDVALLPPLVRLLSIRPPTIHRDHVPRLTIQIALRTLPLLVHEWEKPTIQKDSRLSFLHISLIIPEHIISMWYSVSSSSPIGTSAWPLLPYKSQPSEPYCSSGYLESQNIVLTSTATQLGHSHQSSGASPSLTLASSPPLHPLICYFPNSP